MTEVGRDRMYILHCLIMLAFAACGWFLPAGDVITSMGMKTIGIFVGLIYGWIFIDLIWPSLLGMILLSFTGYGALTEVFKEGFGSEIVLLIIFFSIFTKWLEDIGLTNTLAQGMLSRRILVGRPYLFIFVIFLVTYIVSACVGIYATIFLMWGICYQLLGNLGYQKRERMASFLLIGVAYVAIMGMTAIPWSPWSLLGLKGLGTVGFTVDMLQYSLFMLVIGMVSIGLFMLAGKFVVKIDVTRLKAAEQALKGGTITLDGKQKLGGVLTLALMAALYAPGILPAGWAVTAVLKGLGALGVVVLLVAALCAKRSGQAYLLSFAKAASTAIPWSMVCLLAAVGPLGSVLMSNDAGIIKALMMALQPLFTGKSPVMIYVISCLLCAVATQFLNNTVLLVVMTPILCQLSLLFGANPIITALLVTFALTAALATPGASSRAGLVYGNTEWIETSQAYLQGILSVCCVLAALLAVGVPLGMLLF